MRIDKLKLEEEVELGANKYGTANLPKVAWNAFSRDQQEEIQDQYFRLEEDSFRLVGFLLRKIGIKRKLKKYGNFRFIIEYDYFHPTDFSQNQSLMRWYWDFDI